MNSIFSESPLTTSDVPCWTLTLSNSNVYEEHHTAATSSDTARNRDEENPG
jgi:hypothetical protein